MNIGRVAARIVDYLTDQGDRPSALCGRCLRHGYHLRDQRVATASQIVEDNAHGLFARYKGKYTGTFGCLATQSFHETKNVTCGEGGALLVNDPALMERALIIREKGTNRNQFFRGQVDKYAWVDLGSSYLPSDLLAAFLFAQLEARQDILQKRRRIWEYYRTIWIHGQTTRVRDCPWYPPECEQPYHLFYLLLPSLEYRQGLIAHLKSNGILSVFHYVPLHLSDMGRMSAARETSAFRDRGC